MGMRCIYTVIGLDPEDTLTIRRDYFTLLLS
jgi:hypothetical protein